MEKGKRWLAHYPKEISPSLEYEERPLHSYLQEAAETIPHKDALHFMGKNLTFQEVYQDSLRLAAQLQKLGVEKGTKVAIMLPNTPQSVICYYGALMAGAIVVQVNPLYVEREIKHLINDSGAKVLICVDLLFSRVETVWSQTRLSDVIVTSIKDYLPFPKNLLYPLVQKKNGSQVKVRWGEKTHSFKDLLTEDLNTFHSPSIYPKEDLALLQYTGGTTGPAKGVMLTHYNLVANTMQCRAWMHRSQNGEERVLAVLPFFHVYGMTVIMNYSIMNQAKMIILPKFEAAQVLKTIEKHQITLFPGAPTMYIGLIHHPSIRKYDLSSIEACISGSAPLPREVQEHFEERTGGRLVEGYGLTETSPVVIANPIWGKRKTGSVGVPWPDTEAKILTENGDTASVGEIGEISVRGPQVMKGYWNCLDETEAVFQEDWLLTGDMGYMDEEGYFYIVDRKKDMIIAGGFNIYPREIEEVLYEHEAVQEAAVIGVSDSYRGETVKAFIVLKEEKKTTEEELENHCRTQLAAYKVPRSFEFREELPKTMIGKVLRRVLVEEERVKIKQSSKEGS